MKLRQTPLLLFTLLLLSALRLSAQEWVVPEENRKVTAPYKFTADSIKKGEAAFTKNCQSCHGNPGKKNWAKITPEPGDPASDKFQAQTDGEIFYRVTTGKAPMPEFRNILTENDRWNVISYIRSFNPKYVQPNPEGKAGLQGRQVQLALNFRPETKKIEIVATELLPDKQTVPAKGVEIVLFVKRYFGNLQIGDPKTTNEKGIAEFDAPADLPGDSIGNLELTAMIHDNSGKSGEAQVKAAVTAGKPTIITKLTDTRAWWSVRTKAPVWVILTYSLAVIIVWGFILYIVYSVLKIRKI